MFERRPFDFLIIYLKGGVGKCWVGSPTQGKCARPEAGRRGGHWHEADSRGRCGFRHRNRRTRREFPSVTLARPGGTLNRRRFLQAAASLPLASSTITGLISPAH